MLNLLISNLIKNSRQIVLDKA